MKALLNVKTEFNFMKSIISIDSLIDFCLKNEVEVCAITDSSPSYIVKFIKKCKSNNIKPICGVEFTIHDGEKFNVILFARNIDGYYEIVKLYNNFSYERLIDTCNSDNTVVVFPSRVSDDLFNKVNDAYYGFLAKDSCKNRIIRFGECRYLYNKDVDLLKIILCSSNGVTINEVNSNILNKYPDFIYVLDNEYSCESNIVELNTVEQEFVELFEDFDLFSKPLLSPYSVPDEFGSNIAYLRYLCYLNLPLLSCGKERDYLDRLEYELSVIERANLTDYFLIVRDIVNYARSIGCLVGPGRGSAAGCLVLYLLGCTKVDPIKYGLVFERFYNEGRNTGDRVELPDVDIDFEKRYRDDIIKYLSDTFGEQCVKHISTFIRLHGKAIIREVMRAYGDIGIDELNRLTKSMVSDAKIIDELEDMKASGESPSVIMWTLRNQPHVLSDYCKLDESGDLVGSMANRIKQAMLLEGIIKTKGVHASGIIISPNNLYESVPVFTDSDSVGLEDDDVKYMGYVKFDILGVSVLDKIHTIIDDVRLNYGLC